MRYCCSECGTFESELWYGSPSVTNFQDVQFSLHFHWFICRFTWTVEFQESWLKLHLGVRCMPVHSGQKISKLLLLVALDWCILSSTVMMRGRAHSWKLAMRNSELLHSDSGVWLLSVSYEIGGLQYNCCEPIYCISISNDHLIYGLWCLAWTPSIRSCLASNYTNRNLTQSPSF